MLAGELRKETVEELQTRLRDSRRELFNLRQQWHAGSLMDHNRVREVRREIARILTVLGERERKPESDSKGATA